MCCRHATDVLRGVRVWRVAACVAPRRREQLKREGKLLTGKAKAEAERLAAMRAQLLKQAEEKGARALCVPRGHGAAANRTLPRRTASQAGICVFACHHAGIDLPPAASMDSQAAADAKAEAEAAEAAAAAEKKPKKVVYMTKKQMQKKKEEDKSKVGRPRGDPRSGAGAAALVARVCVHGAPRSVRTQEEEEERARKQAEEEAARKAQEEAEAAKAAAEAAKQQQEAPAADGEEEDKADDWEAVRACTHSFHGLKPGCRGSTQRCARPHRVCALRAWRAGLAGGGRLGEPGPGRRQGAHREPAPDPPAHPRARGAAGQGRRGGSRPSGGQEGRARRRHQAGAHQEGRAQQARRQARCAFVCATVLRRAGGPELGFLSVHLVLACCSTLVRSGGVGRGGRVRRRRGGGGPVRAGVGERGLGVGFRLRLRVGGGRGRVGRGVGRGGLGLGGGGVERRGRRLGRLGRGRR